MIEAKALLIIVMLYSGNGLSIEVERMNSMTECAQAAKSIRQQIGNLRKYNIRGSVKCVPAFQEKQ